MKKDFLDYYSDNLAFIRKLGVEFSKEFPKIANRLDLNALECQDPFIERLLEGTAFLSARVEKKLDDGYDRLLSALILAICPDILSPIPSTTANIIVNIFVYLFIFCFPSSPPSLVNFSNDGITNPNN